MVNAHKYLDNIALFLFGSLLCVIMCTSYAFAALENTNAILCTLTGYFTGEMAAGICSLAIVFLGWTAVHARVQNWGAVMLLATSIVALFSVTEIASQLLGGEVSCESTQCQFRVSNMICNVLEIATSETGFAVCMVGVAFIGAGSFMGRMSWSTCMISSSGIITTFASGRILASVVSDEGGDVSCAEGGEYKFTPCPSPDLSEMLYNLQTLVA